MNAKHPDQAAFIAESACGLTIVNGLGRNSMTTAFGLVEEIFAERE